MKRTISARLERLEAKRRDGVLLIWRSAGDNSRSAVEQAYDQGLFKVGDLVLEATWRGKGEPPAPKWHRDFPKELSDDELEFCLADLRDLAAQGSPKTNNSLESVSNSDLWVAALGVRQ